MQKLFFLSVILFCFSHLTSQETAPKEQSVFFELAGSGGLASLNYERSLFQKKRMDFTLRAGLSLAPVDKNNGTAIVFPIMFNGLFGENAHKLEVGLGQGVSITTKGSFFLLTTAALGYRFYTPSNRWFYRATYTPLISYFFDFQVQHWGGISIGYVFKQKEK